MAQWAALVVEEALADHGSSAAVLAVVSDGRFASVGAGASSLQRRTLSHAERLNVGRSERLKV
jgi:hypothetical protein